MWNPELDELEPTPEEQRSAVRRLAWVLALALAAGVVVALAGCSTAPARPPECEALQMTVMPTPRGPVYLMDQPGIEALAERFKRLQRGECRLPAYDLPEV